MERVNVNKETESVMVLTAVEKIKQGKGMESAE